MIAFKQIPANIRVPLFYAELDNSQANSATQNQRTLIIGQMTSAGAGPANIPALMQSQGNVQQIAGVGSMLDLMVSAYRKNDSFGEVWVLPLADPGGGVLATGSITFTGASTAAGTINAYIGGVLASAPVPAGATTSALANYLGAAIATTPGMPVTASVSGSAINLVANNAGLSGNDIDIRFNYLGNAGGQSLPAGVAATIVAMASGAGTPVLTTGIANLGSKPFDFIICPYTDSTSLGALAAFLNDTSGRWAWSQQIYGHVFTALRGTSGTLTTFGAGRNDQHASVMGFYDSPSPNWIWAPAYGGACAQSLRNDPGLPVQTIQVFGVLAPPVQSQFLLTIQNTLLYSGIGTFSVDDSGAVRLQNVVTSYLTNAYGQPDNSYLEVETMFTLMFVLRFLKNRITTKFGQKKLAADGTRTSNSNVVTPTIIRADQIAAFTELEQDFGLVQNSAAFAAGIVVEQNASNPNRVDILWPGTLIDQLRIVALLVQFRLQ